jgi:carboxyl-terminal processing protease
VFRGALENIGLWLATLALACICAIAAFAEDNLDVASVDAAWGFIKRNYYDQTFNGQDWESLHDRYLARAKRGEGAANLTREMVSSLGDRYSRVVDAQTFERLMAYDPLGIGIVLTRNQDREVVVSNPPFPNSSAAKAGIQQGDVVISIDGSLFSEESMLTVMDRVAQGDSAVVNLSLRRGTAANPLKTWKESFSRSRTQAPQGKIDTGIIAGNRPEGHQVGYARLRSFTARSAIDMADAVAQLRANGADELVLDLRGNLGGSFPAALEIAALFLQPDTVATRVQTPAVQDAPLRVNSTAGVAAKEPLVVLVDQQSASASEVLAAALRGNCRAPLLGTKTYGKAKVQGVFGLPNKEAITLTVARYSGPSGQAIGDGIQPDGPGPAGPMARVAAAIGLPTDLSPADYASIDFATERQQALDQCKP